VSPLTAITEEVTRNYGLISSVTDNYAYTQIVAQARQASVAIVFVSADSGEGFISIDGNEGDRQNLTLWQNGETLIKNVTAVCNNTIVVLHTVGPVLLNSFYDNPNVTGIIWAGLPGEQSGNSIADILYGRTNPGGKLPFTIGASREDYGTDVLYEPNNGGAAPQDNFEEGIFIDYRAFDKADIDPIYEFGYGLSYTTFEYSDLSISKKNVSAYTPTTGQTAAAPTLGNFSTDPSEYQFPANLTRIPLYVYPYLNSTDLSAAYNNSDYGADAEDYIPAGATDGGPQPRIAAGGAPGGNPQLWDVLFTVSATITNTGNVAGEEVVQLYVSLGGTNDAKVVLRNFDRLSIQPGESCAFSADITRRDLSNWDPVTQNWYISDSPKKVYVGSSSRTLPLSDTLAL
jgi:beta-glucosidase